MKLAYWIGLNAADAILTIVALGLGAIEANPLINLVASQTDFSTALMLKVLVATIAGVVIWRSRRHHMLTALNYVWVGVVSFNLLVMGFVL